MFLCLSIQNDDQNKLFWKSEAKMRLKNVSVTFLPSFTGLQWTVHENKALYSSSGRIEYERFFYSKTFEGHFQTILLGPQAVTSMMVTDVGDWTFWWRSDHCHHPTLKVFLTENGSFTSHDKIVHRIVQVIAIEHDQISHANSGIHRHHIRTHLIDMDGRIINVGKLTTGLLHGATRWIQVPDGTSAIALIQIRQNIIIWSWVSRL